MRKTSKGIDLSARLFATSLLFFLSGCENINFKKAGEKITESSARTGEAAKDLNYGISEETRFIIDEIKKGANVVAAEIKEGGVFVSKKGEVLLGKTSERLSEIAITAKIKAAYAKSPRVSALHIGVTTVEDRVILSGKVHCKDEIIEAIRLALSVEGVENVTSLLEIRN